MVSFESNIIISNSDQNRSYNKNWYFSKLQPYTTTTQTITTNTAFTGTTEKTSSSSSSSSHDCIYLGLNKRSFTDGRKAIIKRRSISVANELLPVTLSISLRKALISLSC